MNKRKVAVLKNMKKRVLKYAHEAKEHTEVQYELFQLAAQVDNVFQWIDEEAVCEHGKPKDWNCLECV